LHGLAGAGGAEALQHQIVLLEDPSIAAEGRRLVLPVVDLADGDLELVLRVRGRANQRERNNTCDRPRQLAYEIHRILAFFLPVRPCDNVLPDVLLRPDAARGRALACGGRPPALPRRSVQYSQVRLVTFGMALITPASLVSPAV